MVIELSSVELCCNGLRDMATGQIIKEPITARRLNICSDVLDEYQVPENLVKVNNTLEMYFGNRLGVSKEILSCIFDLEKKCEDGVDLRLEHTSAFTPSDWGFVIKKVINNPRLKFGKYTFYVRNENDITFNLDTDRKLNISKSGNGILTLRGKMGDVIYYGNTDKLKVEGEFKDFVDSSGSSIARKVFDYEDLPDLYESLNERLRRLIS